MSQNDVFSLRETFEAFAYFVPSCLISPEAFSRLKNLAQGLPAALSSSWIAECRLGTGSAPVDLSVRIDPSADSGREILAGMHPSLALPEAQRADPRWKPIRDFCAAWTDTHSSFYTAITALWLEFDVSSSASGLSVPGLFLTGKFDQESGSADDPLEIMAQALSLLMGGAFSPELDRALAHCVNVLPAEAELRWFGTMLSRSADNVRLNIRFPSHRLPDLFIYLREIGWQGSRDVFGFQLEEIRDLVDTLTLLIDLRQGQVQPRIGIECMYRQNRQPESEPRWQTLVDYLVASGLCTPEKGQALVKWSGYFHEKLAHVSESQVLNRRLHHVKLVYQPGVPVEAKGYLVFEHHPIHLSRFKVIETALTQAGQR